MEKNNGKKAWKILAIIFIALIFIWIFKISYDKIDQENECYYNICGKYPDAFYQDKVCTCYDYDVIGGIVVDKTQYIDGK